MIIIVIKQIYEIKCERVEISYEKVDQFLSRHVNWFFIYWVTQWTTITNAFSVTIQLSAIEETDQKTSDTSWSVDLKFYNQNSKVLFLQIRPTGEYSKIIWYQLKNVLLLAPRKILATKIINRNLKNLLKSWKTMEIEKRKFKFHFTESPSSTSVSLIAYKNENKEPITRLPNASSTAVWNKKWNIRKIQGSWKLKKNEKNQCSSTILYSSRDDQSRKWKKIIDERKSRKKKKTKPWTCSKLLGTLRARLRSLYIYIKKADTKKKRKYGKIGIDSFNVKHIINK